MSYPGTEDETTLADIASVEDVHSRGPSVKAVLLTLLGASAGVAAVVLGGGWAFGAISHTEAGFCGRVTTPCTSLSADSVAKHAGITLPAGTQVSDAYYLDWTADSMLRDSVPEDAGFSATVRLPAGEPDLFEGSDYVAYPELAQLGVEVPELADDLDEVTYAVAIDDADPTRTSLRVAAGGVDPEGRRVYAFTAGPLQ